MPKLHIYKNEKETCYAFAEWLANLVKETLTKQDRFTIALSGGDTPKLVYKILATDYATSIDWTRIHLFWGDQSFISSPDEKYNPTLGLKNLIDDLPVSKNHVHSIRTDVSPQDSATEYENLLRTYFTEPESTFDLVILGMGEQGNLLSLYPFSEESHHAGSWVMPVYDKQDDLYKVTLTISAINASAVKAFLITGKKKEDVVQQVLKGKYEPEKAPAQLIVAANKPVHWFLDEGSAGKLIKPSY
ncbi:6-phosphogluconolactonase [Segetibacter aerophilus]|uniref:6-phosphogluconolactonase n=1 Tax=Segetibacter aerophilus TaxID=670293 RepID=A0A512BG66_9BACT|nr:6-phosphogluconolactonase [Segetibacter aerophilus]GEO10956.1 6-phosphogluconolactonase [Segetibacter aerophilus]